MNEYQNYLKEILDSYKCKNKGDYLIILPVYNDQQEEIAYLRPITANYMRTIPSCVELMSRWRAENPSLATGIFTVTHERTRKWLDNLVVGNDRRILFLISDFNGRYLGHIGFAAFDYENKSAEIDSVLRGVKDCMPGLMQHCMKSMIDWGKCVLKLEEIALEVFLDNTHAVEFYRRCKFVDNIRIPMVKITLPDEEKWEPSPDPKMQDAERYFLKMIYKG